MKEQAVQKINKIGKISSVITLIAKIIVGTGVVLSILGAIICLAMPDALVQVASVEETVVEVDLAGFGIHLTEAEQLEAELEMKEANTEYSVVEITEDKIIMSDTYDRIALTMKDITWIVVLVALTLIMTFITLTFVGALCKAFRDCQSPFEDNVICKMQNLAISLIPWGVISTGAESVAGSMMNPGAGMAICVDLGVVLIILVVLVLVYIFKYGAVLQQESDETL